MRPSNLVNASVSELESTMDNDYNGGNYNINASADRDDLEKEFDKKMKVPLTASQSSLTLSQTTRHYRSARNQLLEDIVPGEEVAKTST